jgi:N-acetylneuraminate synthase
MATLAEIETALGVLAYGYYTEQSSITKPTRQAFRQAYLANAHRLREKVTLLHCTTEYPAPLDTVNLRAMATMAHAFLLPVGFSDHTVGISIPIAAVALGAVIIEKHFTVDQNLPGPDHKASLEPQALADMVQGIRAVEQALGSGIKAPFAVEEANAAIARKSLTAIQDIQAGETFTNQNLGCMRPGYGIEPIMYYDYLGKRATQNYHAGALIDE